MQGQTSNTIGNQALQLTGNNSPQVSGFAPNFDDSTAGKTLALLYTPTVQAIQKEFGWDASRRFFALSQSGNPAPYPAGYAFEYIYPPVAVEIWQVLTRVPANPLDPLPTNYTIGNNLVNGAQTKVIWSDVEDAYAFYNNQPTEALWDPIFTEAVVRALAAKLSIALMGKPDTAMYMAQTAQQASAINKTRDG